MMRLAQESVRINVVGDDKVGTFQTVNAAAFIILHEQDVAAFVKLKQRLQKILADPDLKKVIKEKGL